MRKGQKMNAEQLKRMSESHKGMKPNAKQLKALKLGRYSLYIDGRSADPKYRNWQKNQWYIRRKEADGKFTEEEWETMKAQCNWKCLACGRREPDIKLTPDHIIPLSKGGSNNKENRQPLCLKCNLKKHTRCTRY